MSINKICANDNQQLHKNTNFKAITTSIPYRRVKCPAEWQENLAALSHAKYYEALDDGIYPQNKKIRAQNFAFLTDNPSNKEKAGLVAWFKEMTGFPNLTEITQNITNEFLEKSQKAASWVGAKIEAIGFDGTSSVGLKHALPGSDIDKAYVILKDGHIPNFQPVPYFKGYLWENTNQYLMSLNHRDTFPEVYTTEQIKNTLERIDDVVRKKMDLNSAKMAHYSDNVQYGLVPQYAGEFNIELAQHLPANELSKEEVKNFAYFLESVRDGRCLEHSSYVENELIPMFKESPFATYSNVTQMRAHDTLLSSGKKKIKTKLQNRESLEEGFNQYSENKQYRFVVDMIKYISEDQSREFRKFYKNDDNIKQRYDKLNRLLV